ncbi:hypothetical protein EYF80_061915 [Liparis tanakae]|uniref:Uncharacterized protein n=1 Tax=Liparis tanakae TaxID=230148 RepID=A0A4Z2EGP6_9TELE|nr:hypothetical protein EYF80_061915 [Liparis tanakae]
MKQSGARGTPPSMMSLHVAVGKPVKRRTLWGQVDPAEDRRFTDWVTLGRGGRHRTSMHLGTGPACTWVADGLLPASAKRGRGSA